jgi:hypothetical protein
MATGGALRVVLRGERLVLEVPAQPPYVLVPGRDYEFDFAAMKGYSVKLVLDTDGSVRELRLIQPNGVFVATPAPQTP